MSEPGREQGKVPGKPVVPVVGARQPLADRLGTAARKYVLENHDWNVIVDKLVREVLEDPEKPPRQRP